jgi:hypothetical protein
MCYVNVIAKQNIMSKLTSISMVSAGHAMVIGLVALVVMSLDSTRISLTVRRFNVLPDY